MAFKTVNIIVPNNNFCSLQYSTVQYSTVQYRTVQYSTVQYSTVQYSHAILQHEAVSTGADHPTILLLTHRAGSNLLILLARGLPEAGPILSLVIIE